MKHAAYAYPNLAAELAKGKYTAKEVADVAGVGVSGARKLLRGEPQGVSMGKAKLIRDKMFPKMTLDYLFAPDPVQPTVNT